MQNSEQSLLLKELEKEIMSYINTLPPQCHKIFMLSRSYGLKNREIAEQLDISIKAVEKQISKALSGLKEHLIQKDLFPLFGAYCNMSFPLDQILFPLIGLNILSEETELKNTYWMVISSEPVLILSIILKKNLNRLLYY